MMTEARAHEAGGLPGASAPALPRRIAVIDGGGDGRGSPISLVLDDFEEAFWVYARHGAGPDARIPRIDRLSPSDPAALGASADAVVLGCALRSGTMPEEALMVVAALPEDTRLYAIATDERYGAGSAPSPIASLRESCAETGVCCCGGLIAYASSLIPAAANMPRMGMARRRLSEATDRLILAVRCGTDAGTIEARPPIPRFAYRLLLDLKRRIVP